VLGRSYAKLKINLGRHYLTCILWKCGISN